MNNKELLIDFIEYAKSRHVMPILHSNIEPLVDDYLSSRNIGNTYVSGALQSSRCCGRCDGINDICVADMICEVHEIEGCEICYGARQ